MASSRRGPGVGSNRAATLMGLRQLHSYIGAFIAPTVLFLTVTGALQVFSLHEAHGAYRPPELIVRLSRVHKDQVIASPPARGPSAQAGGHEHHDHAARAEAPHAQRAPSWAVMALKWLFVAVATGLFVSTLIGLWLAFTSSRRKRVILALFVLGAALPVALLALQ